ncbi:hypothetical protein HPP92_024172 [Vanilla planifolia]|uniref:TH1 domain-containing protein n=1 Tax=Vanilla planifolia TaxID=51239 RepID=A0A835UB33_VANPL|nr:hypothetical protein HPP92_024172 [Vanilla planifolia]
MDRFMTRRRVLPQVAAENVEDGHELPEAVVYEADMSEEREEPSLSPPSPVLSSEKPLPFVGMKVRRRADLLRECQGDYIGVPSDPYLSKILRKQGDGKVLFADKILRFTGSGKIKQRILLITDFAIYLIDPNSDVLKRRIALAAVDKICLWKTRFEYNAAADMVKKVVFEEIDGSVRTRFIGKGNQ